MIRIISAGLLLVPFAAMAEAPQPTHRELLVPAGKTPVKMYAPIARSGCGPSANASRQTGKVPIQHAPAKQECATSLAAVQAGSRKN